MRWLHFQPVVSIIGYGIAPSNQINASFLIGEILTVSFQFTMTSLALKDLIEASGGTHLCRSIALDVIRENRDKIKIETANEEMIVMIIPRGAKMIIREMHVQNITHINPNLNGSTF